ncbi:hypothetical protein Cni_G19013 [Canna indica]|uniref:Uncharacterized protein n=1 Tax=Canna indica TaxID=4628 RepID=A0AAQ3QGK1_9LILI|nr:hypothetical protein Cni_G19013 [Canna indica]
MRNHDEVDDRLRFLVMWGSNPEELEDQTRALSPVVVVVEAMTSIVELRVEAERALQETYCVLDGFKVEEVKGEERDLVLLGWAKSGAVLWVCRDGAYMSCPLRYEGGANMNEANGGVALEWLDGRSTRSSRVDEDIIEALFGTAVTNKAANDSFDSSTSSSNVTIILRSLTVSRQDILDGILDGFRLSSDVLERITKIALTKEEEDLIRGYSDDPSKLADAESFLFHILRAIPVVQFARLDTMLFAIAYEPEVAHFTQSLQTLEQACGHPGLKNPTRVLKAKRSTIDNISHAKLL